MVNKFYLHEDDLGFTHVFDGEDPGHSDKVATIWDSDWADAIFCVPQLLEALRGIDAYLRDTPHHNAPAAAKVREVIRMAEGIA